MTEYDILYKVQEYVLFIERTKMFILGFSDYHLDEWHANNYPKFISESY